MKLWNFMGGRRNTMVWAAFIVACVCLFVTRMGKPIATFGEWTVLVLPLIGLLVAGIIVGDKIEGDKETQQLKDAVVKEELK